MKAPLTGMEGDGFYNRHSTLQAAAIEKVLPLWRGVAETAPASGAIFRLADYGSSQGQNSMAPIRVAIEALRRRPAAPAAIEVVHTDLPGNDFVSLFQDVLASDESYMRLADNIFPSTIGRSYFEQILPASSVDLAWNSWTLQWMSRTPAEDPDYVCGYLSPSAEVRDAVARQLDADWRLFLRLRAIELKPDGKFFFLCSARAQAGKGWEWVVDMLWNCIQTMRERGRLSAQETVRINLPVAPRDIDAVERPFRENGGVFAGLTLEHAEIVPSRDPSWQEYEKTGDAAAFGQGWRNFIKAVFGPVIKSAIDPQRDAAALLEELLDEVANAVSRHPRDTLHPVAIAILRKTAR